MEGAVKIIYTSIFTHIDQQVYHDLDTLNAAILVHLQDHNNTILTGCAYSRQQQFDELEKGLLKPLNPYAFDPMTAKMLTVAKTGYVLIEQHYYSIPYKYIGKKVKLLYNRTRVEAYSGHDLIAMHERSYVQGKVYTERAAPGLLAPLSGRVEPGKVHFRCHSSRSGCGRIH